METRIKEILQIIEKAGYEGYLVGGSSRDELLNRHYDDVDITTNAPINEMLDLFNIYSDKGLAFYNVKIDYDGMIVEITSFRKECYDDTSSGYPTITGYAKDIKEDAIRRDFTINAIYLDKDNKIHDPFNGLSDLNNKLIRFIGDPITRIKEDPTRILRALRFKESLGFKLEENTYKAIKDNLNYLLKLPITKLAREIKKTYDELKKSKANKIFKEMKINDLLFKNNDYDMFNVSKVSYETILEELKRGAIKNGKKQI